MKLSKKLPINVSLVVPVYKGESFIKRNLRILSRILKTATLNYEIIVVVDGFEDNTYKIVKSLSSNSRHIKVIGYKKNKGKGYAVRYGLSKGAYEYIGFIDAGFDIDFTSLQKMLLNIVKHPQFDAFVADKLNLRSHINSVAIRKIYSYGFRTLVNALLLNDLGDTQTGLKIFKRSVLKYVLPELHTNRFSFDVELMLRFKQSNSAIYSSPVKLRTNTYKSTVKVSDMIEMSICIFRLAWNYHFENMTIFIKSIVNVLVEPNK